jgi:hypothetical protein
LPSGHQRARAPPIWFFLPEQQEPLCYLLVERFTSDGEPGGGRALA